MSSSSTELSELRDRVSRLQQMLADALQGGDQPIVDNMFEGVQLIGLDWRYIYVNNAACEHGRRARDELLGHTMQECYPDIEDTEMFALLRRCRDERAPQTMVNEFTYPDGRSAWFELRMEPVPQGVLVLSVDVTDRVHMERELRQAQKMDAIGQLAGGVAHDFNNLLTAILSFTDLALARISDDDTRTADLLREVSKAARQGARMTQELLTLARHPTNEVRVLDVDDEVEALDNLLRNALGRGIELVVVPSPVPARVRMGEGHLKQVLLNLAVNARDAMPRGGTLTIATRIVPDTDRVELSVIDDGEGMDATTRARVFEPFFSTKSSEGTGLGLAICRRLIERAGGEITVSSEPGTGTRVVFELPRCHEPPSSDELDAPPPADATLGPGTVLVVDDRPALLRVISATLRDVGLEVIEARSGEEALATLTRQRPRLAAVITDVVLPGMSGYDLLGALPAAYRGLPALTISGYIPDEDSSPERHGVGHLAKPFTGPQLVSRLHRLLHDQT